MNENEIQAAALINLEKRLAAALNNAQAAQDDLNRVRMLGSLPPIQYFNLSAVVAQETPTGPKTGGVSLSADAYVELGMVRRGEAVDRAAARKLRLVRDR